MTKKEQIELLAIVHGNTHMILALEELLRGALAGDQILRSACNNFGVKHERVIDDIEAAIANELKRLRRQRRKARVALGQNP